MLGIPTQTILLAHLSKNITKGVDINAVILAILEDFRLQVG